MTRPHPVFVILLRLIWTAWLLAVILGTHWPGIQLPELPATRVWDLFPIDKLCHGFGFFGLMLLTCWAWGACRLKPEKTGLQKTPETGQVSTDPNTHRPKASNQAKASSHHPGLWRLIAMSLPIVAFAVGSEFTQQLFEGRVFDRSDITANLTGALAGFLITLPRHRAQLPTKTLAWATRIAILAVAYPLFELWVTVSGGTHATSYYQYLPVHYRNPDLEAHFWLGTAVTLLLAWSKLAGCHRPRASALIAASLALGLGPFMEIVQFNQGRGTLSFPDVAAHCKGVALGLGIWSVGSFFSQITWLTNFLFGRTSQTQSQTSESDTPQGFAKHAALVSGLTLLSRITGLARDAVLAAVFGLSWIADSFFVAFLIPNLFRRLFGEGALTAAFIPRYSKLLETDPHLARRFATVCVLGLAVLLSGLVLIGEVALAQLLTQTTSEKTTLTLKLAAAMLPYMPLICGVAFIGAVLQVHNRFGPPAAAPILLNLIMILAAAVAGPWFLPVPLKWRHTPELQTIYAAWTIAWAILIAGVLQLAWQILALLSATRPALGFKGIKQPLQQMLRTMIPMVIGLGVFQINAMTDALIAFFGSPPTATTATSRVGAFGIQDLAYPLMQGDVAALQWAQRLYQFPLGVFGIAIATAIFPALAKSASKPETFNQITRQGLRLTVFIGLPATVGLILVSLPLTRLIYERSAFSLQDAQRVSHILIGYASAVWAYSMTHTITRAFYALDDAKTPLKVSLGMVAINLTLNLTLIWPLGAAGLAWSTATCAIGQTLVLLFLLKRRVDHPIDQDVLRSWRHSALLTALMTAILLPALTWLQPAQRDWLTSTVILFSATLIGAIIVLGGAWITGNQEIRWLIRPRHHHHSRPRKKSPDSDTAGSD